MIVFTPVEIIIKKDVIEFKLSLNNREHSATLILNKKYFDKDTIAKFMTLIGVRLVFEE